MRARTAAFTALLLVAAASPPAAQVLERPPRSTGGLFGGRRPADPNRTSQELMLTIDLLGGYDDNLAVEGQDVIGDPFSAPRSGYVGTASAALDYWRGRSSRSWSTVGRAYANNYSGYAALTGGDAQADLFLQMGRRASVAAAVTASYHPTFLIGAFGPVVDQVEGGVVPEAGGTDGVTRQRWFEGQTSANFGMAWNSRHQSTFSHRFSRFRPVGEGASGLGLESRYHEASLAHAWSVSRSNALTVLYRYLDQETMHTFIGVLPLVSHTLHGGLAFTRRMSATRTIAIALAGGATRSRTISEFERRPYDFVSPSVQASLRVDLGRTWAVSADVHRDVTRLDGLAPQPFVSEVGALRAGGRLGSRFEVAVSGAFSRGLSHQDRFGSFEGLMGAAQMSYSLGSCCSLLAGYSYYRHLLRDVPVALSGFPASYDRNAVRVGLTMALPLYGSF